MEPIQQQELLSVAARYDQFARQEAQGYAPRYDQWCRAVARSDDACQLIASLPTRKQQPNLVLAASQYLGVPETSGRGFVKWLTAHWPHLVPVVTARSTQTNEPARTTVLLTLLAQIEGPIALIEVGASAGLCLHPDRYSHVYDDKVRLDPDSGPSEVVGRCRTRGRVPLPQRMLKIVSRMGIDLNPLDVSDPDDVAWLNALVWPGQPEREQNLTAAIGIARQHPVPIIRGDLNERVGELVASVPPGVTPVVQHTAVLAYLDREDRERFVDQMHRLGCRWLSFEGRGVFEHIDAALPADAVDATERFVVSLDSRPYAFAAPHGQSMRWL